MELAMAIASGNQRFTRESRSLAANLGHEGDQVRVWLKHDGKPKRCHEADGYETANNQ